MDASPKAGVPTRSGALSVIFAPSGHHPWLLARVGCGATAFFRAISAVDSAGRIRGMVGYDRWTETSAEMHMAIETPIAGRSLLTAAFHLLFVVLGRRSAYGVVAADNTKVLELDKRIGFREAGRIRDGFRLGVDSVLMTLHRDDCAWLGRAKI